VLRFVRRAAFPPLRPPLRLDDVSRLPEPRPLPLFLPPPSCLFTDAHAMRAAVFDDLPLFFALSSMCSAWRFCFAVYDFLLPLAMTTSASRNVPARAAHTTEP
jgi:hypothetical protein